MWLTATEEDCAKARAPMPLGKSEFRIEVRSSSQENLESSSPLTPNAASASAPRIHSGATTMV